MGTKINSDVVARLRAGDAFVLDTDGVEGGDLLYGEVLEVIPHFAPPVDSVGQASGGYRVRTYCAEDSRQAGGGYEDHYAWDFVDPKFARLSREEFERARRAGWPPERAFVDREFGIVLGDGEPASP